MNTSSHQPVGARLADVGKVQRTWRALAVLVLVLGCFALAVDQPARGQSTFAVPEAGQSGEFFGDISFGGLDDSSQEPVSFTAQYYATGSSGQLEIEAVLGKSWHIYSTTQPSGGPLPTKFSIKAPAGVSVSGAFKPDSPPAKSVSKIYPGVTIEEHEGVVRWSAPIKVPAGFQKGIKIEVSALTCQNGGSCLPFDETLTASFAGADSPDRSDQAAASKVAAEATANEDADELNADKLLAEKSAKLATFQGTDYPVVWTAGVASSIAPGDKAALVFRAEPPTEYHVYKAVIDDEESSTNFVVTEKSGLLVGLPGSTNPVIEKSLAPPIPGIPPLPPVEYHKGSVAWSLPIRVTKATAPGDYRIQGYVCYQACTDKSCLPPMAFEFSATVTVADETVTTLRPIEIKSAKYSAAIDLAASTKWVDPLKADSNPTPPPAASDADAEAPAGQSEPNGPPPPSDDASQSGQQASSPIAAPVDESTHASLPWILLFALAGGFILNFMPCVLPVIGIKIMSFAKQAGEDRKQVMLLNLAYVAGIMLIFAGLSVLAVVFSLGWGEQFGFFYVRLGLTVVIFALALSYLGVWELPTPGVATGKSSEELQNKEGLTGAFFTGAFATILATPCSGPFLGAALAATTQLDTVSSVLVIMTVGLGMSLPYIMLGLFPSAIGFLPKPGNWMVTLKEFLAFLFLGTVAYFFNQFADGQKLAVFVTLIGVWFGCWIIGKVPPWESYKKQLRGWSLGVASAALIGFLGFTYLTRETSNDDIYIVDNHLRWERFNEERLQAHLTEGKTVMLDFTAEWCPNCKLNTRLALDTEPTKEMLDQLDAVPMLADMTDRPPEITQKLKQEFKSKSIPFLVIYPGGTPSQPIVMRDLVTQSMVLDALRKAGPSEGTELNDPGPDNTQRLTSISTTQRDHASEIQSH